MTRISHNVNTRQRSKGEPVDLTIEHTLLGALLSVVFFGLLPLLESPYVIVLWKGFILSITIAAIAAIALLARRKGALTANDEENPRIIV